MLNTFFFGYLSLKWKRLFRTLILIAYFFWIILSFDEAKTWSNVNGVYLEGFNIAEFILLILIPIVSIALISWVVKPFVVKEE
jgi:hypothetical protein